MRSFLNYTNATQHVDAASHTEPSNNTQAPARKMTRVEVEHMLTEYVRDASPGEDRMKAKKAMLACFDALNPSTASALLTSIQRRLHLQTNDRVTLDLGHLRLEKVPENLGFLDGVHSIDLGGNKLESLPESIGSISTMVNLNLSPNPLRVLPESIGKLSELKSLSLFMCKIRALPVSITNLSKLSKLDVRSNELESLPESIGNLSELTTLMLSGNKLQGLPESIGSLSKLLILWLGGNELQSLPESIGNLQSLCQFTFERNSLSELPQSLVCLPTGCHIKLENNPLSQTVLDQLQNAIEAHHALHPHQGPGMEYDMAAHNREVPAKPLVEEIASWRAEGGVKTQSPEQQQTFQAALGKLSSIESNALSKQLARMRVTAHYAKAPKDLVQRVNAFLNYVEKAPDVLQACAVVAVEGTETCDDRIALAFIELEEAIINHQSLNEPRLAKLVETAGGLHKSQLLKAIAQEKVSTLVGFKDPTEIILKYVVNLSKEFNLPSQLKDMIFHRCAKQVTKADIRHAREEIKKQATDANLNTYLATWHPWKQALGKQYPTEYAQAQTTAEMQQETMHEKMEKLAEQLATTKERVGEFDQEYLDLLTQSNQLYADYRNIETSLLIQLTEQARQQLG